MLDLKSERWTTLEDAYGAATGIPDLLRHLQGLPLAEDWLSEPYYSLWSALCHQGDVYTASYAAVPHIVNALLGSPARICDSALHLAVAIEIGRARGRGPEVPADLRAPYFAAIRRLPDIVHALRDVKQDETMCRIAAAALFVTNDQVRFAEAILLFGPEMLDDFMDWADGLAPPPS
jgi:hypothetical protein